jgi:hypothetical protein
MTPEMRIRVEGSIIDWGSEGKVPFFDMMGEA